MKKPLSSALLVLFLVSPLIGYAQVTQAVVSTQSLSVQLKELTIQLLRAQLADLQSQLAALIQSNEDGTSASSDIESYASTGVSQGAAEDQIVQVNSQCSNAKDTLEAVRVSEDQNDSDYTTKSTAIQRMVRMGYYGSSDGGLGNLTLEYKAERKSLALEETKATTNVSELCN